MNQLTLTTPALLFSAISLLLLAYTNRFLAYATVVRNLHKLYKENPDGIIVGQIQNLRKRLVLTRTMQLLGIGSLLLCVGDADHLTGYFGEGNTNFSESTGPSP